MQDRIKELQKLGGVGEILSRRFVEAGYDSFAKVAAAGEAGLAKIPGINPKLLGAIVAQAQSLSGASQGRPDRTEAVRQRAAAIRKQVQMLALNVRERLRERVAGKQGKRTAEELLKLLCRLEKMEVATELRVKRAAKALSRVERRLEGLTEAGIGKIGKRLKKARKALKAAGSCCG